MRLIIAPSWLTKSYRQFIGIKEISKKSRNLAGAQPDLLQDVHRQRRARIHHQPDALEVIAAGQDQLLAGQTTRFEGGGEFAALAAEFGAFFLAIGDEDRT